MELVIQKYDYKQREYLICDCNKAAYAIGKEEIRIMCSTNFGIQVASVLLISVSNHGQCFLTSFDPDGTIHAVDERETQVFTQYLSDAGYFSDLIQTEARKASHIYLCEHFLKENQFQLCGQTSACAEQSKMEIGLKTKDYQLAV